MPNFASGNKINNNMARTKKAQRATSFVTLRVKNLSKGRKSFYLDVYKDGMRHYEFLKLYLVPATSEAAKIQNDNTKQAAEAIRSQRELDIIQNKGGIKSTKASILLTDLFELYRKKKIEQGQSEERAQSIFYAKQHIKKYAGEKTPLNKVDASFCKGFISYLSSACSIRKNIKNPRPISQNSTWLYFNAFVSVLNYAVEENFITKNPVSKIKKIDRENVKAEKKTRSYLTIDEVKKLMATNYEKSDIRRAFLFSCFTGLRVSDITKLRWCDIKQIGENMYIEIVMKKTQDPIVIKLNQQAKNLLPICKSNNEVFNLPIRKSSINEHIKRWAKQAGIKKDVCYHMSRHTFATMELTLGGNLYVVSKLLGHKDIGTTQIYADIVNKQREETIDLLDKAFN